MKSAVIIFHKNLLTYYKPEWIKKCYDSIRGQYNVTFDVFEIDYGGTNVQSYEGSTFFSEAMNTHSEAHDFLLDQVFMRDYDAAFNVNVDDWYALNRFELQLPYIEQGYDVVSSNFYRVNEDESVKQEFNFSGRDFVAEAKKGHNIMAHPVICYSRHFWLNCDRLNPKDIPQDDFILWQKSYKRGFKFVILPEFLLFQRIHTNNISKKK
jgi:hypothetical protein